VYGKNQGVGVGVAGTSVNGDGGNFSSTTGRGIYAASGGTYAGYFDGKVRVGILQIASDQRLKRNIATIDNALNKVNSLRGVSFEWRKDEFPEKHFADGNRLG